MKKVLLTILIAGSSTFGFSQFTANNLVVLRANGTGGAPSVSLVEYDRGNYSVKTTVTIPSTGANRTVLAQPSGNNYEGLLHLSADRNYLMFVGYDADAGTTGLSSSASTGTGAVLRVVVKVNASGTAAYIKSPIMSGVYTRAVAATDANNVWAVGTGSTNTVKYLDLTATQPVTPVDVSPAGVLMNIKLFYNKLYVTSDNNTPGKGLYALNAADCNCTLPKTTAVGTSFQKIIDPPSSGGDFTDFVFFDTDGNSEPDLLYVATNSDTDGAENLHKYVLDNGTWVAKGHVKVPTGISSGPSRRIRGLVGNKNEDGSYTLYASSFGYILKYMDNTLPTVDIPSTATFSIIATAPENTIFRGIAFTPGSTIVLPVTLKSFSGKNLGTAVLLNWATASEQNNSHFEILRSGTGEPTTVIGTVKGNGNSNMAHNYSFTDKHPLAGVNYYQLRQVDFDNKAEKSKIITVTYDFKKNLFEIVAKSVGQLQANIYAAGNATGSIKISDMTGRVLSEERIALKKGYNEILLKQPNLKGIYVAALYTEKGKQSVKFVY